MRLNLKAVDQGASALMDKVSQRYSDKDIRDALLPAANIVRDDIRGKSPVVSGRLKKSVKSRKARKGPVDFVVIDRRVAKRDGYSYAGRVIYLQNKKLGTNFFDEGWESSKEQAATVAVEELRKLPRGLF